MRDDRAALLLRRLMETAEAAMKDGWGRLPNQGARGLMHLAQAATADVQGTSTVCVALMQPGCTLQVCSPDAIDLCICCLVVPDHL